MFGFISASFDSTLLLRIAFMGLLGLHLERGLHHHHQRILLHHLLLLHRPRLRHTRLLPRLLYQLQPPHLLHLLSCHWLLHHLRLHHHVWLALRHHIYRLTFGYCHFQSRTSFEWLLRAIIDHLMLWNTLNFFPNKY